MARENTRLYRVSCMRVLITGGFLFSDFIDGVVMVGGGVA